MLPAVEPQTSSPGSRDLTHLRQGWGPATFPQLSLAAVTLQGTSQGLLLVKSTLVPKSELMRVTPPHLGWSQAAEDHAARAERSPQGRRMGTDIPMLTSLLI